MEENRLPSWRKLSQLRVCVPQEMQALMVLLSVSGCFL